MDKIYIILLDDCGYSDEGAYYYDQLEMLGYVDYALTEEQAKQKIAEHMKEFAIKNEDAYQIHTIDPSASDVAQLI